MTNGMPVDVSTGIPLCLSQLRARPFPAELSR